MPLKLYETLRITDPEALRIAEKYEQEAEDARQKVSDLKALLRRVEPLLVAYANQTLTTLELPTATGLLQDIRRATGG